MQSIEGVILLAAILVVINFFALLLMLTIWERQRDGRFRTALYAVMPMTGLYGVAFAFPSKVSLDTLIALPIAGIAAVFFVLLARGYTLKRAAVYTGGLIAVSIVTPFVVRVLSTQISPRSSGSSASSSPSITVFLAVVGFPALVWYLSTGVRE